MPLPELALPGAEGQFRRAIAQSGAAQNAASAATTLRVGRHLAEKIGVAAIQTDWCWRIPATRQVEAAAKPAAST